MSVISHVKLPNNQTYNLKDSGALQLTGGSVTGETTFGDSTIMDEITVESLLVTGSISIANGLDASQITSGTLPASRLATSGVSAGSYGPLTNATLSTNDTVNIPYVTVDAYGRVTNIVSKVITMGNMSDSTKLPLTGGIVTGTTVFNDSVEADEVTTEALLVSGSAIFSNGLNGALTGTVNGYTVAAAAEKNIVTDLGTNLLSTNLPTSAAVANYVAANYVSNNNKVNVIDETSISVNTDMPTAAAVIDFVKTYIDEHCVTYT